MQDWFSIISTGGGLPAGAARDLRDVGFAVIPGPTAPDGSARLAAAYDPAVASASPDDVGAGRTTTRVHDFVNRGSEFDELCVYRPVLEACCRTIRQPFKLSTMLARTVRPRTLGLRSGKPHRSIFIFLNQLSTSFRASSALASLMTRSCPSLSLRPW